MRIYFINCYEYLFSNLLHVHSLLRPVLLRLVLVGLGRTHDTGTGAAAGTGCIVTRSTK